MSRFVNVSESLQLCTWCLCVKTHCRPWRELPNKSLPNSSVIVTHKPQDKTLMEKILITVNSLLPQACFYFYISIETNEMFKMAKKDLTIWVSRQDVGYELKASGYVNITACSH